MGVGVQAHGLQPHLAQTLAHLVLTQILQGDAIPVAVRKGSVGLSLAREVGPQIDRAAHIDDDQKGRPFVQSLGIGLGLTLGGSHQSFARVLRQAAAPASQPLRFGVAVFARLLGLQDKAATPIAIDAAGRRGAVVMQEPDGTFKAIVQVSDAILIRRRRPDQATQIADEGLIVRPLGQAAAAPFADEVVDVHGRPPERKTTLDLPATQPKRDHRSHIANEASACPASRPARRGGRCPRRPGRRPGPS